MAGKGKYVFDHHSYSFRKARRNVLHAVGRVLIYLLSTASLTICAYLVFSLFFSTSQEKRLKRENAAYEMEYASLLARTEILEDAIDGLRVKEDGIYREIFHTEAPDADPMGSMDAFHGSDTIPDTKLVSYSAAKSDRLCEDAVSVEENFDRIFRALADKDKIRPPFSIPLEGCVYSQVGASKGEKFNPFYKTKVLHEGLDFIASQGTPVYASASGVVSLVSRSNKGLGKTVRITHPGGYETLYAHLSDISVSQGQRVIRGGRIGTVGMSGNAYAPHLHYEVHRDGEVLDPIGFLFGSVGPEAYANMLYIATKTEQSMD